MQTLFVLLFTLFVQPGERINDALAQARAHYAQTGEGTTIMIAPGDYEEELTIDIPNIRLINTRARKKDALDVHDGGLNISSNAVRISWYYGHGYQYASMGANRFNWGGKRERRWNASTLVTAPGFYAEGIIFQNSFNIYVSPAEARDTLVQVADAKEWLPTERPRRMPDRPKDAYNTDVQQRYYGERASALSFTSDAKDCHLLRCRVIGRQDAFYGDHGAEVTIEKSILQGSVDYIFGGLELTVKNSLLIAQLNEEKNDGCYITAGRGYVPNTKTSSGVSLSQASVDSIPAEEYATQGMLFSNCTVRYATRDEIVNPVDLSNPNHIDEHRVQLARPWRWWGRHVFCDVRDDKSQKKAGVLYPEPISLGLTKKHPAPFVFIEK